MSNRNHTAFISFLALILVWAYSWIVMKQVLAYCGPFDFAALKYTAGALVLFLLLALRGESLRPTPWRLTISVGVCQTAAFQDLTQWALVSGGAGRVSLLAFTMPFWTVLFAWWLLRERPGRRQWLGLGMAAGGLVCIMQPWQGLGGLESMLLALGGGIAWALGTVLTKQMFRLHAPSPLSFTTWQMIIGALILDVIALATPSEPIRWTPEFIAGLLYCALLASSLAWVLWTYVIKHVPATIAGLSSLAIPVVAVLMAWVILSERPGRLEILGIVLITCALLIVSGAIPWRTSERRDQTHALRHG